MSLHQKAEVNLRQREWRPLSVGPAHLGMVPSLLGLAFSLAHLQKGQEEESGAGVSPVLGLSLDHLLRPPILLVTTSSQHLAAHGVSRHGWRTEGLFVNRLIYGARDFPLLYNNLILC